MTEIRRSWEGGPLREWSEERGLGSYMCSACWRKAAALYFAKGGNWLCRDCREKGETAE